MNYPRIIQGGMGVAVSSWGLARAVSACGQMGVVSGTALDVVLARRLQLGDIGGHIAEAFSHFPIPEAAERVWNRYFVPGGKDEAAPFKSKPLPNVKPSVALAELIVLANFVEVWLAKKGHSGVVGINFLEKIQVPTLPSIYGAMLAGVDVVLMGAGIPRAIPGVIEKFSKAQPAELMVDVAGGESEVSRFDPASFTATELKRPMFLAIVSSASLAQILSKKCNPPADGFVIEAPTAGGHNAPPRGALQLSEAGEPIYGERDIPDFAKFREIGLPFWLAGSRGTHEGLQGALAEGAEGIQVGTAFAYCDESGIRADLKATVIKQSQQHLAKVFTDPKASPTGFPFKVVQVPGTMSELKVFQERKRICDLGYLREMYLKPDGTKGYRCPSEPIEDYLAKGGDIAETVGRKCVCNGLMSTIGLGQIRDGYLEPDLVTSGDDVADVARFLRPGRSSYSAADVIESLLVGNTANEMVGV